MIATNIIDRFLDPFAQLLPAETAQQLVDLKIDEQLQERLDVLADKANRGLLSEPERVEYEEYVEALDLIAIIKAKARAALRRRAS